MGSKVVILGATGFIGRALCRHLSLHGYEIIGLSRNPPPINTSDPENVPICPWDAQNSEKLIEYIDNSFAVINLVGENIASGRWTKAKKERILHSRIDISRLVVKAIRCCSSKPEVFLQASAIGYYGNRSEEQLDEKTTTGRGFLAEVCRQWEAAVQPCDSMETRLVIMRLGAVLGRNGGMLAHILPQFKMHAGGYPGNGRQWMSWIHIEDVLEAISFLLRAKDQQGVVNLVSPEPVRAREFYRILARLLERSARFPIPAITLKLLLGEMAGELILTSQRVIPKKLQQAGYNYRYNNVTQALQQIVSEM